MEQSVTTGRRGLRLRRSKPTRSRIAELTRRASQKTDWEEGRCERKLPSTLSLPVSRQRKPLGRDGGGILTTTGFPPLCAMCHVPAEGEFPNFARGSFYDPRAGGVPNPEPRTLTEFPNPHAPPRALPKTTFMWSAERP